MKSSNKLPILAGAVSALALSTAIIYYNMQSRKSSVDAKKMDNGTDIDKMIIKFPTNEEIEDAFDLPSKSIKYSTQQIFRIKLNFKNDISFINRFFARRQLGKNIFDKDYLFMRINLNETIFTTSNIKHDSTSKTKFDIFSDKYWIIHRDYDEEELEVLKPLTESVDIGQGHVELNHSLGWRWNKTHYENFQQRLKENKISFIDQSYSFVIHDAHEFNKYVIKKCKENETIKKYAYELIDLILSHGPASIVKSYYSRCNDSPKRDESDSLIPVFNTNSTRFTF